MTPERRATIAALVLLLAAGAFSVLSVLVFSCSLMFLAAVTGIAGGVVLVLNADREKRPARQGLACLCVSIAVAAVLKVANASRNDDPFTFGADLVGLLAFALWPLGLSILIDAASRSLSNRMRPWTGRCAYCDYDLTGNVTGRCPECGRLIW